MAGQVWSVNTLGGYTYSLELSDELRNAVQPLVKFRQFCDWKVAHGKRKGQTFTWDIVSDVGSAGGFIVETNTVPETNFTISQGTLTVSEAANAVPYSGMLDNLSKFEVSGLVKGPLKRDFIKFADRSAWAQFNQTPLRFVATSTANGVLTTNGTATSTNSVAYNNTHAKVITDTMKERNIPAYIGDDYYAIAWPTTLRTFKNNLETIHQYTSEGFNLIMNGEIGRYENMRYVEQTNIVKGISTNGITGTAWSNALSDWIFFFGSDTVAEGLVVPEEIRGKLPGDYGRSKGVAWYYLGGFGLTQTTASQARILKWDSAA